MAANPVMPQHSIIIGCTNTQTQATKSTHESALYMQLSSECRSLLDRIFEPDVKQRITVDEIMQHPWYLHSLPSQYQSQLQHLDQVQASKDAHMRSRQLDPVGTSHPVAQV